MGKFSQNLAKNKKTEEEITKTLERTGQHLKYKKRISVRALIIALAGTFYLLTIIFLYFLPVFQIKTSLEGITLFKQNFSIYENYRDLSSNYNASAHKYTDMDPTIFLILSLFCAFIVIGAIIDWCSACQNAEKRAIKTFRRIKTYNRIPGRSAALQDFYVSIIILILLIVFCKFAEYKVTGDITAEDTGRYLYYYFSDGRLALSVYKNNFHFCNALSEYFAIPVISFICATVLSVIGYSQKKKITRDVLAEKLPEGEEPDSNAANR